MELDGYFPEFRTFWSLDAERNLSVNFFKMVDVRRLDRIKALLAAEEDLENVTIIGKYKWNESLYSKLPTSLLPETEKNAQMINEILIKSWETQGSTFVYDQVLLSHLLVILYLL